MDGWMDGWRLFLVGWLDAKSGTPERSDYDNNSETTIMTRIQFAVLLLGF
jgi:hypothetical protein